MECNKDEALRAKEIAERKYAESDIVGARKFALKAQALFPGLDGISQMIATLGVHFAAENPEIRVNGEKDWYAILRLDPGADEDAIKKQYRKLALMLHPDKNKSVGGEAAFQIISEAFGVLSDNVKRMVYNHKRNQIVGQKTSVPVGGSSGGRHPAAKNATSSSNIRSAPTPPPSAVPPKSWSKNATFWTMCPHCKMQYQYAILYFNHSLLCPKCRNPFLATEMHNLTPEPSTTVPMNKQQPLNQQKNAASEAGMGPTDFPRGISGAQHDNLNSYFGPFHGHAKTQNTFSFLHTHNQDPNRKFSGQNDINSRNLVAERLRKLCEEKIQARSSAKRMKTNLQKQAAYVSAHGSPNINLSSSVFPPMVGTSAEKRNLSRDEIMGRMGGSTIQKNADTIYGDKKPEPNIVKTTNLNISASDSAKAKVAYRQSSGLKGKILHLEVQNMLRQKAQNLIRMELAARKAEAAANSMALQEKQKQQKNPKQCTEKEKDISEGTRHDTKAEKTNIGEKIAVHNSHDKYDEEKDLTDGGMEEVANIDVPDPDFHDFDKDRSENVFKPEQMWAVYDDEDGMPRYYAFVQKVLSRKQFKIRMSYLVSRTNDEFSSLNWVGMGFAKVCGNFRIGKYEICDSINMFSHEVRPERGPGGIIKILPRKGDIWALYRNWSPEWNEHTPDDVMYKYDMVEVLEDYDEKVGISVTPLLKRAGFKTVFSRSMDPKNVMRIPKEEMFRFSHQVRCYILTGEEAQNAPRGCYELDPAATPLELLQVTPEVEENGPMKTADSEAAKGGLKVEIT